MPHCCHVFVFVLSEPPIQADYSKGYDFPFFASLFYTPVRLCDAAFSAAEAISKFAWREMVMPWNCHNAPFLGKYFLGEMGHWYAVSD